MGTEFKPTPCPAESPSFPQKAGLKFILFSVISSLASLTSNQVIPEDLWVALSLLRQVVVAFDICSIGFSLEHKIFRKVL